MPTRHSRKTAGFTLIELLVVITVIAILAALLVPTANKAMVTARRTACIANVRQVTSAVLSNTYDNKRRFPSTDLTSSKNLLDLANFGGQRGNNGTWRGNMDSNLRPLFRQIGTFDVFHCPVDLGDNNLTRNETAYDEVGTSYLYPITSESENADVTSLLQSTSKKRAILLSQIPAVSKKVIVFEPTLFHYDSGSKFAKYDSAMWHGEESASVMGFADGHAAYLIRTSNEAPIDLSDGLSNNEEIAISEREYF